MARLLSRLRWRGSIRARLLILALLPMLVLMPMLLGVTMQRWLMRTDQILLARISSDLTVGREYLLHLIDNTAQRIDAFGASAAFAALEPSARIPALDEARSRLGLDFLVLEDAPGATASQGIKVFDAAALNALAPGLADRARIPLAEGGTETRGMVIWARAPLPSGGALVGGILLNHNIAFIDRINDLVYPAGNPTADALDPGMDHGVTTLFLGDIRISTTLRPEGGERALGTRASVEVTERVMAQGQPWRDNAFVVNDWYFSAYEALRDIDGNRVGMLYAGIPKAPYTTARKITFLMIGAAFAGVLALFIPLFLQWARSIFHPVEAMGQTIARVEHGDMAARTGPAPGAPELTRLAGHLDQLLAMLEQRERALQAANQDLNARVEARTADLLAANQALAATTRQLVLSAKLATIGEVTTGVAHEINNPLAVISGNLEVVRMVLAERQPEAETELLLIEDQIRRIAALVSQMLQFARPDEFPDTAPVTDPVTVIAEVRPLVQHLLGSNRVQLIEDTTPTRPVAMPAAELQQVLVNLISNAVQAMPKGGTITLSCRNATAADGSDGVAITLADDGPGIPPEIAAKVFDPFFTTRSAKGGTGLGLSICQNLVARAAGQLSLSSKPGVGTRFQIWLPATPPSA